MREERLITAAVAPDDEAVDRAIRPKRLADYVGQKQVKAQLEIFVSAARNRGEALDHVLVFDTKDVVPIIRALRPDVHVKGTDYTPDSVPEAAEVRAYGGRVAIAGDPKDHSTTELLARLEAERKG